MILFGMYVEIIIQTINKTTGRTIVGCLAIVFAFVFDEISKDTALGDMFFVDWFSAVIETVSIDIVRIDLIDILSVS